MALTFRFVLLGFSSSSDCWISCFPGTSFLLMMQWFLCFPLVSSIEEIMTFRAGNLVHNRTFSYHAQGSGFGTVLHKHTENETMAFLLQILPLQTVCCISYNLQRCIDVLYFFKNKNNLTVFIVYLLIT